MLRQHSNGCAYTETKIQLIIFPTFSSWFRNDFDQQRQHRNAIIQFRISFSMLITRHMAGSNVALHNDNFSEELWGDTNLFGTWKERISCISLSQTHTQPYLTSPSEF